MDLKRNKVEDTNDSAVISKHSMCQKGYASDPYLKYFVSERDRQRSRSPLINRFYYLRFKAIEYALNRFNGSNGLNQIISIGCGFDTSFLRYPQISFIEIDFPFVAINKANILIDNQLIVCDKSFRLRTHLNGSNDNFEPSIVIRTDNYCLIGADLRKYDNLKQLFIDRHLVKNVNKGTKVCLLNECSLCYLKQDISDQLIQVFTDLYQNKCQSITYLGFEQLKPIDSNDGFSRVMLNHFQTIGSPLKTFLTKHQTINRFRDVLKFDSIHVLDMKTFFDEYIENDEKQRINTLEMFDEYEEFDSVCSCYGLTIAQSIPTSVTPQNQELSSLIKEEDDEPYIKCKNIERNGCVLRFGHSSCLTNQKKILVFGGFGCHSNDINKKQFHKRLSNFIEINPKTYEIIVFNSCDQNNDIKGIHSQIVELEDQLFLISGGRLSPSSLLDNKIIRLSQESQTYEIYSSDMSLNSIPKVFRHLIIKQMDSNKVIQIGGKQLDYNNINDNFYYVLDTNTMNWNKQKKGKLFTGIHSHSGTALNSNVFLVNGGLRCDTNAFTSNSLYLIDERVSDVNEIKVKKLNHLYSHSLKLMDENKVLVMGGMAKSGPNARIDLIDLRFNKVINSFGVKHDSTSLLINFSSEIISTKESSHLWVIGGGGNCFSFGTHFNELSFIDLNLFVNH